MTRLPVTVLSQALSVERVVGTSVQHRLELINCPLGSLPVFSPFSGIIAHNPSKTISDTGTTRQSFSRSSLIRPGPIRARLRGRAERLPMDSNAFGLITACVQHHRVHFQTDATATVTTTADTSYRPSFLLRFVLRCCHGLPWVVAIDSSMDSCHG